MILLPRGNPVKENGNPGKVNLPDALDKLRQGQFTGYLRFDFTAGTSIFIFQTGRLISALFETPQENLIAYDAIARTFDESLRSSGRLDIYRLSPELAFSIHALLHGEMLHRGQDLQLIDIRSLLARMRDEQRSGCLRIYSHEHIALIFYRDGRPLGFFHDGSTSIETTADSSMSVAREPGAKVDVLVTRGDAERALADLMETADIAGLWNRVLGERQRQRREQESATSRSLEMREDERRQKAFELFRVTAQQHLGRIGASLVEKEFDKLRLNGAALGDAQLGGFYDNLARAAKLVDGPSKIQVMLDEMKRGARTLLSGS
jgi:hypothetical protein